MAQDSMKARLRHHLATRISTLRPPRDGRMTNPLPALRTLTRKQWLFFLVALAGWTWDAFDFFTVSLTATEIAETLDRSVTDITWGITLVLMLRSVGALIFGVCSDKFGRKWPFIFNCMLFIALELGTGFVQTYKQFLAVRALFGIAMGGIYGNCAATALEDCPIVARGIVSGMLQEGYALGYLLAVIFNRALTSTTAHGWRSLFWFGAAPPVLIIIFRLCLPETDSYLAQRELERSSPRAEFFRMAKASFKGYWHIMVYLVILMAGFNFMSHGSQDLYPTMLTVQLGFSTNKNTVTMVVANLGAIAGGIVFGHISDSLGRRLSIMIACVLGGALIYPWAFVRDNGIMAAVFFLQFMVQGAWGVVPIYLSELSPPAMRAFIVGTAYQLGNLASSASSTIEAKIGERFPLEALSTSTVKRYDYGKVMAIFMGCVFGFVLIVIFLGPEHRGAELSVRDGDEEYDADMDKGGHLHAERHASLAANKEISNETV
ncbi:major facilitator superfamily domain-containing protein [Limtongia smithiae]|uniref:major facilitator superfamily domain-containing protein n=1 Tax=Limtongia smithiae TaxID=1125753 RepID=UPI0034CF4858